MSHSDPAAPVLTILTPTWNRRHLLPSLYQSLLDQQGDLRAIEWLVVDDGSTDDTYAWLEQRAAQAPFQLRVIRQQNGGKHRAVNQGAKRLRSPWVLILDSDDAIMPGGLQRALDLLSQVDQDPAIQAVMSPMRMHNRSCGAFNCSGRPVSYRARLAQSQVGDCAILMRSTLLQAYPFPEYPGERFIAESSAYGRMFRDGGILLSNAALAEGAYQPGGLSDRSVALRVASPLGAMETNRVLLAARPGLSRRLRCHLNYHRFWWHAWAGGHKAARAGFRASPLWLLPGWLMYRRDRRQMALAP